MHYPNRIFVFGDSLQDNGNVSRTLGAPNAPYMEGRFSNGPVASEHLADYFEQQAGHRVQVCNFAHGGALTSGHNPKALLKPHALSVTEQIDVFKSRFHRFDENDLVLIDGGGNNLFFAIYDEPPYFNLPAMFRIASDIAHITDELIKYGAQNLVVWNVPDVSVTPTFNVMRFPTWLINFLKKIYHHQVTRQNRKITESVHQLQKKYTHAWIQLFDAYTFLNHVIEDPAAFGFENTTDPCVDSFGGFNLQGEIQHDIPVNQDPETHLFWDWVHPTAKGQTLIAQEIYQMLQQTDQR